mmetsp:Transcript_36621/g.91737  ORF Transcript_36621/g.91737 Transcript_36621/m.91737 type:complete len:206 (-) Transcript_36621:47-664(-)
MSARLTQYRTKSLGIQLRAPRNTAPVATRQSTPSPRAILSTALPPSMSSTLAGFDTSLILRYILSCSSGVGRYSTDSASHRLTPSRSFSASSSLATFSPLVLSSASASVRASQISPLSFASSPGSAATATATADLCSSAASSATSSLSSVSSRSISSSMTEASDRSRLARSMSASAVSSWCDPSTTGRAFELRRELSRTMRRREG